VVEQAHRRTKIAPGPDAGAARRSGFFPASKRISAGCAKWSTASIMRDWAPKLVEEMRHLRRSRHDAAGIHEAKCQGASLEHDPGGQAELSVPARLIGERVRVHLYHDHLEVTLAPS